MPAQDSTDIISNSQQLNNNIIGIPDNKKNEVFENIKLVKQHVNKIIDTMQKAGIINIQHREQFTTYINRDTKKSGIAKIYDKS